MIPPIQSLRMRSITRWMKDNDPQGATLQPEVISSRASSMDQRMMETFDQAEDALMERLMRERVWGTEAGLQQFSMGRLQLWQETVSDFMPTSLQNAED